MKNKNKNVTLSSLTSHRLKPYGFYAQNINTMDYKEIKTNPDMDKTVKENLKMQGDNVSLYALKRIEELEEKVEKQELFAKENFNDGCKATLSDIAACFGDEDNLKKADTENDRIVFVSISETIKNFPLPKFNNKIADIEK